MSRLTADLNLLYTTVLFIGDRAISASECSEKTNDLIFVGTGAVL
jgi:hypothetical protein